MKIYKFFSKNFCKKEEIKNKFHKHDIKTITIGFSDLYGRYLGKKLDADYFVSKVIKSGSNACNYLLSCDIAFNPLPDSKVASYEIGFGDFTLMPDVSTVRDIDYINNSRQLLFFCDLFENKKAVTHCPRYTLKNAVNHLESLGMKLEVGANIQFQLFNEKYRKIHDHLDTATPLTEHNNLNNALYFAQFDGLLNRIAQSLRVSGIDVDEISAGNSFGQYSLKIKGTDPITFCENITLAKLAIKKIAEEDSKSATFMAKNAEDVEGNSLNIFFDLKDKDNNSLLELKDIKKEPVFQNEIADLAIKGLRNHIPDFLILYAPTINSFKRLKEDNLAEHFNEIGFMESNKGINVIKAYEGNNVVFRLPGSDVNTYLTLTGMIYSMAAGIKKSKSTEMTELPINLNRANKIFSQSEISQEYLGKDLHHHLNVFYSFEFAEFNNQVDEYERNRYLYNI